MRCSTSADGTAWPRPIACASASTRWSASSNAAGALGGERGSASVRPSLLDRHQSARCFARLNGSVAHGPYAAHRKRLRVPTRDGPSRTQRCAWDYDNAAHGTTACGRTGGGMPCGGWNRHSVGAYEPKGRSRRIAGAPGAHPRRSTARGRRALGARSAPHRMRMRRQPWIPRGAPRTPCESVGPAATPAGLATAARATAQRRRSDRGWTHAAAGCAAAVARGGPEMVRHDLACRLDGGVGLTLLVSKEAEEPANPQSHKCRGRQCVSAPCVDAVLWDTMAREIAACGPH